MEAEITDWWTQKAWYAHSQLRQVAEEFPPFFGFNFGQDNRIQVDTDEVESQGNFFQLAENWSATVGGTFASERYYRVIDVPNEFAFPAVPAGTTDIEDTRTQAGVFGEMLWEPLPGWHLVGNLRYDHYSDFDDPITWRVGSSYRVEQTGTVIHANYGTAFAPPAPQDVATAFGGLSGLEAERSRGYEAGITQPFAEGRIEAFATWFHQDVRDLIEFRPVGFEFIPFNIGEATLEAWNRRDRGLDSGGAGHGHLHLSHGGGRGCRGAPGAPSPPPGHDAPGGVAAAGSGPAAGRCLCRGPGGLQSRDIRPTGQRGLPLDAAGGILAGLPARQDLRAGGKPHQRPIRGCPGLSSAGHRCLWRSPDHLLRPPGCRACIPPPPWLMPGRS
ncbi:MAG: TonB-dependent receptor [Bdellovibrionaceae bacterium]|nr:TonB-dependent receptor [Pseudobdellovibrionaceae bacterium]